jgi:hypothetical protein
VEFRIEIIKTVAQQRLSVYSIAALGAYLDSTSLSEVLAALAKRFQDRLIFECQSGDPGLGSRTLSFVKAGAAVPDSETPLPWRHHSLELLRDTGYRTSITESLLPQDFAVVQPVGAAPIDMFLARAGAALSAIFLSNVSDFRDNQLGYRIIGYKLLTGTVANVSDLVDASGSFLRVANWAYGPEGSADKIGLARNVITLCVMRLEDLPAHPEIWDAIQSNYQIYLKDNITTYLEVRNKLAELLAESTHKTHLLAEGLLDSIRNGVLITLTFLLTVVVINGLKDTGVQVIFSIEYLAIVGGVLILISLAVWASCQDAYSRFDQGSNATSKLLKRMYAHVMIAKEIEEQVKPTIEENRAYLNRQTRKYQVFWRCFASIVGLAFLAGYLIFGRGSESSSHAAGTIERVSSPSVVQPDEPDAPALNPSAGLQQSPGSNLVPVTPPLSNIGEPKVESTMLQNGKENEVASPSAEDVLSAEHIEAESACSRAELAVPQSSPK